MDSRTNTKDQQTIRKALAAIRSEANVSTPVGPLAEGLGPHHEVLVATFVDRDVARQFQKILTAVGIDPDIATVRSSYQVTVDAKDVKQATALYFEHKKELGDGKISRNPRRHDLILLGTIIGLTLGSIIVLVLSNLRTVEFFSNQDVVYRGDDKTEISATAVLVWTRIIKASTLTLGLFVIVGHLGDRFRMKKFKNPESRTAVDIWELMWLIAIPVMAYSLFVTMAKLLPMFQYI